MDRLALQALDEITRLQGHINDLISIHALAAVWVGYDEQQIVAALLEVIVRMLGLEFACARFSTWSGGAAIEMVRLAPDTSPDAQVEARSEQIRRLMEWFNGELPEAPAVIPHPIGPGNIHIAVVQVGPHNDMGRVVLSSRRPGFPSELEMTVLRLALNQAVIGLQDAGRRRGEERLRRSEAQLAEGQRLSGMGSWRWNLASEELLLSDETSRTLGFDTEQPTPDLAAAMKRIHEDDRGTVERLLESAVRGRKDYEFETRLALPDGTIKHVRCTGRPFTNEEGALEYVGTLLDITQRRHAEQLLQAAEAQLAHVARVAAMGELTASIAHEVKQPLAAILTNGSAGLRWLAAAEPNLDEARAALARIVTEADRASQVVDRVRTFLQRRLPERSSVAMNEVIQEVLGFTRYRVIKDGVLLRTQLAPDLHEIRADPVQLQQVLVNLIVNAIEATASQVGGRRELLVCSRNQGPDEVVISVRDSGAGIDPDSIEELFKPFVTSKAGGLGMGLPISRAIVEAHGGTLRSTSNSDQGATFEFSLPAKPGANPG